MRRLAALAAVVCLLLLPVNATTVPQRVAVFMASGSAIYAWNSSNGRVTEWRDFMDQLGIPYDVYNVDAPTWDAGAMTDNEYFSANYSAVFIPLYARSTVGLGFETNFDAGGWAASPFMQWDIPVYVYSYSGVIPEDEDAAGGDQLRMGVRIGGSRLIPTSADSLGTHRYKVTSYLRNAVPDGNDFDYADTLYSFIDDGVSHMVIESPAFAAGVVQPIVEIDTTNAGSWPTDSRALIVWGFQLDQTQPRVVYSIGRVQAGSFASGMLSLIELMCREADITPRQKIRVTANDHHSGTTAANDPTGATYQAYLDKLALWKMYIHASVKCAPCDYDEDNAERWPMLRAHINKGLMDWHMHSHQTDACGVGVPGTDGTYNKGWSYDYPAASDTAQLRSLYNKMLVTCANPDSMGLPMSAYNPRRITPANGAMPNWALKVVADAGGEVVDLALTTSGASPNDHAFHNGDVNPTSVRASGERLWIAQTASLPHDNDWEEWKDSVGSTTEPDASSLSLWFRTVEQMTYLRGSSWFWHSEIATDMAPTGAYFPYLIGKLGEYVAQYPTIMEWERRGPQTRRPANF